MRLSPNWCDAVTKVLVYGLKEDGAARPVTAGGRGGALWIPHGQTGWWWWVLANSCPDSQPVHGAPGDPAFTLLMQRPQWHKPTLTSWYPVWKDLKMIFPGRNAPKYSYWWSWKEKWELLTPCSICNRQIQLLKEISWEVSGCFLMF